MVVVVVVGVVDRRHEVTHGRGTGKTQRSKDSEPAAVVVSRTTEESTACHRVLNLKPQ